MRVLVISLRNLIWGAAAFCLVIVAGVFLLLNDPLQVSAPYQLKEDSIQTSLNVPADPFTASVKPTLALDVQVDGTNADVKMLAENFQFVPEGVADQVEHGKGHAHLYLDGQLFGKIYKDEFMLKNLPKGEHKIRIELNYSNHTPYHVEAEQDITIK